MLIPETIVRKYCFYLHWKDSGMLSGRFGDKDAQRRLNEIRSNLKELGLSMKYLEKFVDRTNFRNYL